MVRRAVTIGLVLLVSSACGKPFFRSPTTLAKYKPNDPRDAVVGRWSVEFARGDSVARGELDLTDSLGWSIASDLQGRLDVDLAPVLGHPLTCLLKGTASHTAQIEHDTLYLAFAGSEHCFLNASAAWYGDSAVGRWMKRSQISAGVQSGRFRMRRR
ncbi:MAG TPA: hypothetical protein VFK39_00910 [Gemmatimonadaceae bacterium]|jgi:hypothetical protein|nr:hypothetical protein [Gemmatimonadaceae bacterium]